MRWMAAAILAIGPVGPATAAAIDGNWQTPANHGVVELAQCDGGLCGRVLTSDRLKIDPAQTDARNSDPSLRGRTLKGLYLFRGMTGGPRQWVGKVYNPDDGNTYAGKITLKDPDTLSLQGCIVFPLCKTQTWSRLR